MTNRFLLSMSVILSAAIAAPAFAQERKPGAYALYLPDVGMDSEQLRRSDVVNGGPSDVMPTPLSVRPWKAGSETATRPWSAPVGHHQPTAVDVAEIGSRLSLDQEDAKVDRIVRGVCRGC